MHVSELLLFMLALSGPASCATSGRPDGPFQLYAYGENVGGLVLFSDGGINHLLITHNVSLVDATGNDTSHLVVDGFAFYGAVAFATDNGGLVSRWQGIPSGVEGVYNLKWNETEDVEGEVLFTLTVTVPAAA
ncbi:putative cytochrome p450 protein [Ilyonectria robusta]